ncbi:MAG: 3-hydroxyacyl-CoA dehydrogenase family protein [Desulfobacterales bacterium]|nr:3-hydroxyacyl-CoA dehydrogenase family protein [Desulfobacterales bacterium]
MREFAEKTSRPDRFVGLHYFYHPAKNRLLEVIPHSGTSPQTVEKSLLAAKLHGKTAILVKDAPGFAVNRFFVPFLNEAARMLEEGLADIATIEEAANAPSRSAWDPFELMNVTGIPIAVHAATTLGNELGPFYAPAPILKAQMEKKANWKLEGQADEVQAAGPRSTASRASAWECAAALVDEGVASHRRHRPRRQDRPALDLRAFRNHEQDRHRQDLRSRPGDLPQVPGLQDAGPARKAARAWANPSSSASSTSRSRTASPTSP